MMEKYLFFTLINWNVIVFGIFGYDKYLSKKNNRRIRERTLLLCALFGGACGAWAGMYTFRHKTQYKKFVWLVPTFFVLNMAVIWYIFQKTSY